MNKANFVDNLINAYGSQEGAIKGLRSLLPTGPVEVFLDLQVFLNAMGREEESFEVSEMMMKKFPTDTRALFNRGWHLLKRGKLNEGLSYLEHGRDLKTYGHLERLPTRMPFWNRKDGYGQRVHLTLEGGFGDEIIHFRFGKILKEKYGCHVNVICSPGLASVFAREPWVSAVLQREAAGGVLHDSWLPGMSAALALGLEYPEISDQPYLRPDPVRKKHWKSFIGATKGLKIGIRWSGNPSFEHQQLRLFDPSMLINLKNYPGVQLFSFQRDNDLRELPDSVVDLGPHLKDWDDTVAALSEMDLVITSCTSVAHMSAALGCPTWVMVPALAYFIWSIPGRTSPWYSSAKLFRQTVYGNWSDVDALLNADFQKWLNEKKQ